MVLSLGKKCGLPNLLNKKQFRISFEAWLAPIWSEFDGFGMYMCIFLGRLYEWEVNSVINHFVEAFCHGIISFLSIQHEKPF